MKTITNILISVAISAPLVATAEPPPKAVEDMECLVGTWKGAGTMAMGKDTAKVDATWTCKRTSARWGVLCTFHVTGIPGLAAYEETDLMGYDPGSNAYHWYAVTNAGETHDHVAPATDGHQLEFVYTGTQDGKPIKEVIDLEVGKDHKTITARAEAVIGGAPASVLQIALRK